MNFPGEVRPARVVQCPYQGIRLFVNPAMARCALVFGVMLMHMVFDPRRNAKLSPRLAKLFTSAALALMVLLQ